MAGLLVGIKIFGLDDTRNAFRSLGSEVDLSALLNNDELRLALGRASSRTINRQDYPQLKEATRKRKIKKVGQKKILEYSQGPANMISLLAAGISFDLRAGDGGKHIDVTFNRPLPAYHQFGASNLPIRHVIEVDQELVADVLNLANELVKSQVKEVLKKT